MKFRPMWISVYDRLPETYGDYLTCDREGNIHVFFYHPEQSDPFNISPCHAMYYQPTHWMYLPEPPETVEKEK